MINHELQVYTHDLNYQPYTTGNQYNLPGDDGDASEPMAFSTHNNVIEVAQFIELLDNKRIINKYISTVKCTKDGSSREWRNACWIPPKAQVVYGQRMVDNLLISYGESLEIVAHEIFHGITAKTARLESRNESGALNESYSDILAVIIFNHHRPNIADWIWEIGRPFGEAKQPIRSLQTPSQYKQPEHYNNYRRLKPNEQPSRSNDKGYIHHNCGIHNKAAANLLTTKIDDQYLFEPATGARLFYLTLTEQLTPRATFSDSRDGLLATAGTLFRDDLSRLRNVTKAITQAFQSVGIS